MSPIFSNHSLSRRLDSLELSNNKFDPTTEPRVLRDRLAPVSSLLELAAVDVVRRRIRVTEEAMKISQNIFSKIFKIFFFNFQNIFFVKIF